MTAPRDWVQKVWTIVRASPRGLSEAAVGRLAGKSRGEVVQALKELEREGQVHKAGGRWRASDLSRPKAQPEAESVSPPTGLEAIRRLCSFYADVVQEVQSNNWR
jgi:predicted transcriptional regulator